MPQLFPSSANTWIRWILVGVPVLVLSFIALLVLFVRSPWATGVDQHVRQPVQFSHANHVSGYGIDCRYCHVSVERSSFADIPPTETCMSCHSQVWTNAPILAPVRESFRTGAPLQWTRVTDLPDFTYFNHGIHIRKGVSCVTCHGRVDQMQLMRKAQPMFMSFCLECHRNPAPYLRPREEVFNMAWAPEKVHEDSAYRQGRQFIQRYHIDVKNLTDCTICHR